MIHPQNKTNMYTIHPSPRRHDLDDDAIFLAPTDRDLDLAERICPTLTTAPDEGEYHYSDGDFIYYSMITQTEKNLRLEGNPGGEYTPRDAWFRYSYRTISGGRWEPDDYDFHYPDEEDVAFSSLAQAVTQSRIDLFTQELRQIDNYCYNCMGSGLDDMLLSGETGPPCTACGAKGWHKHD